MNMSKKIQVNTIVALIVVFTLFSTLTYAVSTTLQSPANNFVDDDGFFDLNLNFYKAECDYKAKN